MHGGGCPMGYGDRPCLASVARPTLFPQQLDRTPHIALPEPAVVAGQYQPVLQGSQLTGLVIDHHMWRTTMCIKPSGDFITSQRAISISAPIHMTATSEAASPQDLRNITTDAPGT